MTYPYSAQVRLLLKRLLVIYLLYFFCRLLFFVSNRGFFESVTYSRFLADAFYGLRFDSFSIVISNALFILLSLLPFNIFWHRYYQRTLRLLFVFFNSVFLAFNCIDIAYFPFIRKRSTSEILQQLGGQTDVWGLIPRFAADFWWVLLFYILLVYLLILLFQRIRIHLPEKRKKTPRTIVASWLLFLLLASFAVLGARGGLQRVPIDLVNAGSVAGPDEVPIVLNTPFSIIKSYSQKALEPLNYFSETELSDLFSPIRQYGGKEFRKENVVVLILESFSKEYTRLGNTVSLTPFLDSLMEHSLLFKNAYSNGTKSIEGIPAILSSLPSLMPNPVINSLYANNEQTSLAWVLGQEGYSSAFFHGGINGTMNFDDWAALAGYQQYYGRNEYNNENDFDKFWGIWDEPFLQWSVEKMNTMQQPFHSAVFTLSSHHPYFVPEQYKGKLKKTDLENSESINYADLALRKFFSTARNSDWFRNTLFVLVADHTGISGHPYYSRIPGIYSIPILFYKADNSLKGTVEKATSQIDILPSVLDYLGYNKKFMAFGRSFQETKPGNNLAYMNSTYYQFGDSTMNSFDLVQLKQTFNYQRDSLIQQDIKGIYPETDSLHLIQFKAFMQSYHSTLINNSGRLKQ